MSASPADLVLLLHGQPGGARDWDRVGAAVGGRAPLLAVDRPGWRPGTAPTDLAGNAADALAILDRRRVERAVVVGHSLGGAVAAWLAALHPERVAGLVLVAPAATCSALVPLDYWLARPLAGEFLGWPLMAVAGMALSAPPARRYLSHALGVEERYLAATGRGLRSPFGWRAFAADQRALVRDLPRLEGMLASIAAPTIVVAGGADRIVPVASARELARSIPGASLVVLDGAGHLLPQRRAAEVAEIIVAAAA